MKVTLKKDLVITVTKNGVNGVHGQNVLNCVSHRVEIVQEIALVGWLFIKI